MGSTLAQFETRILAALVDAGGAIYTTATVDEALRHALSEYSQVCPLEMETVLTLPGAGREIDLSSLTGLLSVSMVWWPFDSTAEAWPPNQVKGFRIWWDDTNPVLFLMDLAGGEPQTSDELRAWYTASQTIQNLDSAAATTVRTDHESLLVLGASAYAALARAEDLVETAGTDLYQVGLLGSWGVRKQRDFQAQLDRLRASEARRGPAWGHGWSVDKWDSRETGSLW